jgi:ribosomal protein S12 methylthiotransferase accessory factor YcaO
VERIVTDLAEHHSLEPDQRETELLSVIAAIADEIEELKRTLEDEGRTVVLKDGRVVMHGAVVELRLQRAALAKLLASLKLDATGKDPVKQAAAMKRWAAHNAAKRAFEGA